MVGRVASVVEEVAALFPDALIHLGGDEVDLSCYASNATLSTYMAANNFSSPAVFEAIWMSKLLPRVKNAGKTAVVWQEMLDNLESVGMESVLGKSFSCQINHIMECAAVVDLC